ncbi:MAG TPA: class I SAM-dependent methyltransferase [Planctomycetes bacterium]|nr:class I SAM-dependent methyltransferase [Planctomycetota bacterium]
MRKQDHWKDGEVAGSYDRTRFAGLGGALKQRRDESLVLRLLAGAGPRVLDLPCGTGRLGPALRRRAGKRGSIVGVDLSRAMLDAGGGRAEAFSLRLEGSVFRLPFRGDAFDAAVVLRFLFHLDDTAERIQALAEIARVTAGPIICQVRYAATVKHASRALRSRVGLAPRFRPSRGRRQIETEIEAAGLRVDALVPVSRVFSDKAIVRLVRR